MGGLRFKITTLEAKPPRQINDAIPKELERICLKALSKRASDRYTTAKDMADDLRHFLDEPPQVAGQTPIPDQPVAAARRYTRNALIRQPDRSRSCRKGLRSFDAHDADFFLELLPGSAGPGRPARQPPLLEDPHRGNRRRRHLPVGLIYGPSGCGKSSLVKAGCSLGCPSTFCRSTSRRQPTKRKPACSTVCAKRCPALPTNLGLKETLAALRRGQGIPVGKKVLIVLDQFEQWLHAKKEEENTDLVQALRQCDGGRVQCIVMVRDDFWMAATRFMRELGGSTS